MNMGVQIIFSIFFPLDKYPQVEFLDDIFIILFNKCFECLLGAPCPPRVYRSVRGKTIKKHITENIVVLAIKDKYKE